MEQVPHDVVQDRFERLVALQERITEENLKTFEGRDVEVMVTGASGKKDAATHRVTGREKPACWCMSACRKASRCRRWVIS